MYLTNQAAYLDRILKRSQGNFEKLWDSKET
jgi:hypothetical protein